MRQMAGSSFFGGPDGRKSLVHNVLQLQKGVFVELGRLCSVCIIQCAAYPRFLSVPVAQYIAGVSNPRVDVDDIPDMEIRQSLNQVC